MQVVAEESIEIEVKEKNLVPKDVKQYFMRCIPDMKHILHVLSELFDEFAKTNDCVCKPARV